MTLLAVSLGDRALAVGPGLGLLGTKGPAGSGSTGSGSTGSGSTGGGTTTPPVTTPPYVGPSLPPSTNATKFFATPRASSVAPGSPIIIDLEFNGIVPISGTISATAMGSNGTLDANTITLDGSAKSFTYTPNAAGEHNVSFTNTAGLYNSAPAPLNCWAAGSGAAKVITASLRLGDQAVHQRDVPSGQPRGFATANTAGHGEVWVDISSSVPALFARLYDRRSNGATSAAGSGAELTSGWVQVYGAMNAGGRARLLLPAIRAKQLYLDLATDAAGTNPVRVANCFAVGTVLLLTTRSQLTGYARGFAMGDNDNDGNHINKIVNWFMTAEAVASAPQYGGDTTGTWARVAGEDYDPFSYKANQFYNEPTSNATMEAGRLIDQQTGMMLGITGVAYIGDGWQSYIDDNGQPNASTMATMMAASGGKARYWIFAGGTWDDRADSDAAYSIVYDKAPDWIMKNVLTMAVVGICMGATGIYGTDGSRNYGYTRNAVKVLDRENALPHMISIEDHVWNLFKSGHASQGSRVPYPREHMRLILSAERASWGGLQTVQRGPTLVSTGSRSGAVISIPINRNGATSLSGKKFTYPTLGTFAVGAASSTDLVSLVAVYPHGGRSGDGVTTPIPVASVAINSTAWTLDITLAGSGPYLSGYTVHYASDFGVSGGTGLDNNSATVIVDNIDPFGVGYGQHMRPKLDIAVAS